MKKLKARNFECIKMDNSEMEYKKQWKRSKIVFDNFYEYLKRKGLKEESAGKQTEMVAYFIMDYLFVYDCANSILEVSGVTIRKFLGNWYIRKDWGPKISIIKDYLRAISNFYKFLNEKGFISKEKLGDIKEVCKDIDWFEMRIRTYFMAEGDELSEWIDDYNYGSWYV
jgi:hypothetical protein